MDILQQYKSKIEQHLNLLSQLEKEYEGRNKSKIYLEKRRHHKDAAFHWKDKLEGLGKESSIMHITFSKQVSMGADLNRTKSYETMLIGVNAQIAQELILLEHTGASNFKFRVIQPGILKEI